MKRTLFWRKLKAVKSVLSHLLFSYYVSIYGQEKIFNSVVWNKQCNSDVGWSVWASSSGKTGTVRVFCVKYGNHLNFTWAVQERLPWAYCMEYKCDIKATYPAIAFMYSSTHRLANDISFTVFFWHVHCGLSRRIRSFSGILLSHWYNWKIWNIFNQEFPIRYR